MFSSDGPFRPRRAFLRCLTLVLLFAAPGAEAQLQIGQQVAAPAYYWPGDAAATTTDWTALNATGPLASSPGVTTIAIANVNNGPDYAAFPLTGNNYSPNWATVISAAHANGIKVLGYVDTGYFGTTSPAHRTRLRATDMESWRSQIEHDIDAWYSFYGSNIDGIFLDEAQNTCGPSGTSTDTTWSDLYHNVRDYVKNNHPGATVAANPGVAVPYCYEEAADILVTFENQEICYTTATPLPSGCTVGYASPQSAGWPAYADPNKFWHMIYDVPGTDLTSMMGKTKQNNAGYVYMTELAPPVDVYGEIPYNTYWSLEQSSAAPVSASSTAPTTPTGLQASVLGYTTATIEWSLSSGPNTVVAYDIYQSGVSENGGRMWSVPQPATGSGQTTAWVDLDGLLQPNTSYTFTVAARDAAGLVSSKSTPLTFTTLASTQSPPSAPGSLTATATSYTSATLSWQASTGALTVVAYDVYQNGAKIVTLNESITNGPAKSTTIIGLTPGQSPGYVFTVKARDYQGNVSPASNAVTVSPTALPGAGAISSPAASYSASTGLVTYSANFLVPFSNHRVFIWSGNAAHSATGCYYAGFSPTQLCADYLIQDDGSLWAYTGNDPNHQAYSWTALAPVVQPTFSDPTTSSLYTWQIPLAALAGGNVAAQQVMYDADGFFQPTYSGIVNTTSN
jgi:hypothetical protein